MTTNRTRRIKPQECGLLVVDIQERMMRVIAEKSEVIKNSKLLLQAARQLAMPMVFTGQNVARLGNCLPELAEVIGEVTLLDKMEFDCFANTAIAQQIAKYPQVTTWVVCGVETHICIYQTVMGGLAKDYAMWVPADAVSSRSISNYQTGLSRIAEIGGIVANTEMVIYELLQRAGTADFKALLPFLK